MSINTTLQQLYLLTYPLTSNNINTQLFNDLGNPPLSYTGSLNHRLRLFSENINLFRIESTGDYIRISDGTFIY